MTKRKYPDHIRLRIARELYDGEHIKEISFKWKISQQTVYSIFYEYLEWKMHWKDPVKHYRLSL